MDSNPFLRRANPHRLYRSDQRIVAGVVGGMANYFGWNVTMMRLLAVVLTLATFPLMLLVYVIAAFMIPRAPTEPLYKDAEEEAFWRTTTFKPQYSFGELRHRMRELESRLRGMEAYMTSPRYELDRELHRGTRPPH